MHYRGDIPRKKAQITRTTIRIQNSLVSKQPDL